MPTLDLDTLIRDRAYALWEAAGRPCGHEHQHWAEARRQIEHEHLTKDVIAVDADRLHGPDDPMEGETLRMREALYRPEPFSFELFGGQCPDVEPEIVLRPANERRAEPDRRIAA